MSSPERTHAQKGGAPVVRKMGPALAILVSVILLSGECHDSIHNTQEHAIKDGKPTKDRVLKDGIDALAERCVPPFGRGQSRSILIEQMKSVTSDSHDLVPDYAVVTPIISGPGTDDPYRLEAVIYPRSIAGAGWRFIYEDGRWLYTGEREHEEYEE